MRFKPKKYSVDILFALSLFAVFAITSLLLVFSGTRVYENIATNLESTFASRTAISYLKKQIDQNAVSDAVSIDEVEGAEVLRLEETLDGDNYVRYIYLHEGYLCELYTKSDIEPQLSAGQALLELKWFEIDENGELLTFTVADHNDSVLSLTVATP